MNPVGKIVPIAGVGLRLSAFGDRLLSQTHKADDPRNNRHHSCVVAKLR